MIWLFDIAIHIESCGLFLAMIFAGEFVIHAMNVDFGEFADDV